LGVNKKQNIEQRLLFAEGYQATASFVKKRVAYAKALDKFFELLYNKFRSSENNIFAQTKI